MYRRPLLKLVILCRRTGDLNQLFEPIDWRVHRGELVSAKLSGSVIPDPGTATRLAFVRGFDGPYDEEFFRAQD